MTEHGTPSRTPAATAQEDPPSFSDLAGQLQGDVGRPGEPVYTRAAPWNRAIVPDPAAVVAVESAADVATTVRWAGENGYRVAVQATGHSAMRWTREFLLIDTSRLREVEVDADARTATFGAGVEWAPIVAAAAAHGLAPVTGSSPSVGAVGFLSGGGVGPLSRSLGLASDRVRHFKMVTGDGMLRRVSAEEYPDLFSAFRGGKAAAGIVTSMTVALVERATIYGGQAIFAADAIAEVMQVWTAWARKLPQHGTTSACIEQLPLASAVPAALSGRMTVALRFGWTGEIEEGRRAGQALLERLPSPLFGSFQEMPISDVGTIHNDPTEPMPAKDDGYLMKDFDEEAAAAYVAAAGPGSGSRLVTAEVRQLGGRIAEPPAHPDAVDGRAAGWNLWLSGNPLEGEELVTVSAKRVMDALQPWAYGLTLPNLVPSVDPALRHLFYRSTTLNRFAEISREYDPLGTLDVGQAVHERGGG